MALAYTLDVLPQDLLTHVVPDRTKGELVASGIPAVYSPKKLRAWVQDTLTLTRAGRRAWWMNQLADTSIRRAHFEELHDALSEDLSILPTYPEQDIAETRDERERILEQMCTAEHVLDRCIEEDASTKEMLEQIEMLDGWGDVLDDLGGWDGDLPF